MDEIKDKVEKILKENGIADPKIKYTYNYTCVGACDKKGTIYLSVPSLLYNTDDGIKSIIVHEIAHLTHFNHGEDFKLLAEKMGYNKNNIITISKYVLYCPRCHKTGRLNIIPARIKRRMMCKHCDTYGINQKLMVYKHDMEEKICHK
jgi:predicted SprT family Zn-dependent metalloprotease